MVEPTSSHEIYAFNDGKRVEVGHHGAELQVGIYLTDQSGVVLFAGRELVRLYRILEQEVRALSDGWEGEP